MVGETKNVAPEDPPAALPEEKPSSQEQNLLKAERLENPHWEGKQLRVAVGQTTEKEQQMAVPFAVLNASARTIEVLPPQIQLAGTSRDKHRKAIKAEPVAIKDYWMTARRLAPGARADGVVVFERPSFKESGKVVTGSCPGGGGRPSGLGADCVCGSGSGRCKVTLPTDTATTARRIHAGARAKMKLLQRLPIPPLRTNSPLPEFATRAKQRARQQIQQNRFVIIGAGAIVIALLIFVAISMPHRGGPEKAKNRGDHFEGRPGHGNQQREQRQEPISDHRFRAARRKRSAPRFL